MTDGDEWGTPLEEAEELREEEKELSRTEDIDVPRLDEVARLAEEVENENWFRRQARKRQGLGERFGYEEQDFSTIPEIMLEPGKDHRGKSEREAYVDKQFRKAYTVHLNSDKLFPFIADLDRVIFWSPDDRGDHRDIATYEDGETAARYLSTILSEVELEHNFETEEDMKRGIHLVMDDIQFNRNGEYYNSRLSLIGPNGVKGEVYMQERLKDDIEYDNENKEGIRISSNPLTTHERYKDLLPE